MMRDVLWSEIMSNYGENRESSLNKADTMSGSDYIRAVISGESRNISLTNLVSVIGPLLSSFSRVITSTTSTTNYQATISNDVILMDLTLGDLSVTLPVASTCEGKIIQIKKIDATTNDITVQTSGETIDGAATATLTGSGGSRPGAAFISDGANWYILNA